MSQERQLVAIMFTDIEGYTALMQHDESNGVLIRERHRKVFEQFTEKFHGKIIQYFGDGTLSTFKSSVEAVKCAIEIQRAFREEPKIPLRIGIHVGDIIQSEDDIVGDAVNVASRIESCAISGSILISDKVHDQVRSHRDIKAKFIDAYEFKNVDGAMPVFAIANDKLEIPEKEEVKSRLKGQTSSKQFTINRNKLIIGFIILTSIIISAIVLGLFNSKQAHFEKSIAVLPFDNLSSDDDAELFRDGITEDILTHLSKVKELHVISRTSVMQYKATEKTITEIAKELGVSYILEGSLRKYGNEIRVTAQLIDARNDEQIWADNYDKTLIDIFAIQSEIARDIVDALELNLSFEEQQSISVVPTKNIEAYQFFLRGRQEADKRNSESIASSVELYEKAIAIDSNYAEAYAEIANSIFLQTYYGNADPIKAAQRSQAYLEEAERLNNKISRVYTVKGLLYNNSKEFDKAKMAFERAIQLSPNDVTARHQYATYFYYVKQYDKQLEQTEIAYKLDPLSFATASSYFTALTANEKYEEAERLIKNIEVLNKETDPFIMNRLYMRLYMASPDYFKAIEPLIYLASEDPSYYRFLGYSYAQIGDTINAYKVIDSIKKLDVTHLKNHRVAVVYAGLKENDSVFYYLDPIRNKSTFFNNSSLYYFNLVKKDLRYEELLRSHGIKPLVIIN